MPKSLQQWPTRETKYLTKEDKLLLDTCKLMAKGIAATFGEYCEVVLHSLEDLDASVIAIENGHVTGRAIGSPMTDFALSLLEKAKSSRDDIVENYASHTVDGKRLKSTTVLIRNASGTPIGMLCINLNVSAPADNFLRSLYALTERSVGLAIEEHYPHTARDLIETKFRDALSLISQKTGLSATEKNRAVVEDLYRGGIFQVKSAVDIVADALGISRYTVYNYIRDIKAKPSANGETASSTSNKHIDNALTRLAKQKGIIRNNTQMQRRRKKTWTSKH
jgi:predicted transcriptional regulator YheO